MKRWALVLSMLLLGGAEQTGAQATVEARGIALKVRLEEILSGHLAELNGKFRLRATEATFAPGALLGVHHHVGPGIRYVIAGQLTFTQGGGATIYKTGDVLYESGAIAHAAENRAKQPLRVLFVEILPAEWVGATVIPPKAY